MRTLALSALALLAAAARAVSPFATTVVTSTGFTGGTYGTPSALLGAPSDHFGGPGTTFLERTKLVEGQYGTDATGNPLVTRISSSQSVTVSFDHDVTNDANNPYGIDFLVFGNSFFTSATGDFADDSTNLNGYAIDGGVFGNPISVSVSPDNLSWYTYASPANAYFPTNAYRWDRANAAWTDQLLDFTKPVNPNLTAASFAGKSAADAIDLYGGSAGGAGYDLAVSGFSSIRYIRVTGIGSFAGVLDGFADVSAVNPTPEPATLAALGLGALAFLRRRRR